MLEGIAATWNGLLGRRGPTNVSSSPGVGTVPSRNHLSGEGVGAESVRRWPCTDWFEHHTSQEHAAPLVRWIQENVDLMRGMLFRDAVQEFYAEAVNGAGWTPRPWNPVARELGLLCTGGAKPYVWVMSKTGRMRRRRHYPIPHPVPALESADARRAA
jgi:hypothetical protein